MELAIIVAAAENHVIGRDNGLIWHLSADLKRFKALTTGRALPNRRNVVISGNPGFVAPGAEVVPDIPKALELLKGEARVFVIGGGSIYREFWDKASQLYLTEVHTSPEGDTFIPAIDPDKCGNITRPSQPAGTFSTCLLIMS